MKQPHPRLVPICLAFALGCASPRSGESSGGSRPGPGASAGGNRSSGAGSGGSSSLNVGGASSAGSNGVLVDPQTACVASAQEAEQVPVDLYFMVDKSGSMDCRTDADTEACLAGNDAGSGPTRWEAVTGALESFVTAPAQTGVGVGVDFFPELASAGATDWACVTQCAPADCACISACGCRLCECQDFDGQLFCGCSDDFDGSCRAEDYAAPAVEIATLPGAASGVEDALTQESPGGGTPTVPALQGAIEHAKEWAALHPGHRVAVVFTTDGEPDGCDASNDIQTAMAVAAEAAALDPPILTYVIGVGPSLANLNDIATAGGTHHAYLVESGTDTVEQLSNALNGIRAHTPSCDYVIPEPGGGELDYDLVNVRITAGSNGTPTIISQASSKDDCGTKHAWHYDDSDAPRVITLCPSACDAVLQAAGSKMEVLMGCKTVPVDPK